MKLGRNKDKTLPCRVCRGTGWIPKHTDVSRKMKGPKLVQVKCTRCNGSGRV